MFPLASVGYTSLLALWMIITALFIGGDYLIILLSVLAVLGTLLLLRLFGRVGTAVAIAVLTVIALSVGYKLQLGERVSLVVLKSIIDTDAQESMSMMRDYALIFVYAGVYFIVALALYLRIRIQQKLATVGLLVLPMLLIPSLSLVSDIVTEAQQANKAHRLLANIMAYPESLGDRIYGHSNLFYGDVAALYATYLTKQKYSERVERAAHEQVRLATPVAKQPQVVVLIMGESSVSSRYSAYGYDVKTTPNLEQLMQRADSCLFEQVHSAAPITRDSVAMTLSFFTPENISPLFEQKSLINYAKDAGFRTYWLTAQRLQGMHDTQYGFIASQSDVIEFAEWEDNNLPALLSNALADTADKKLIILHQTGSHRPYANKFDAEDTLALPDAHDYDKSIHKTDRVLKKIVDILDKSTQSYSLMFTSDHGEMVDKGHGMMYGSGEQYYVPLWLVSQQPDDICRFTADLRHQNGWISSLSNKYILLKLLGYETDAQFIQQEVGYDRVLHPDGQVYEWLKLPTEAAD